MQMKLKSNYIFNTSYGTACFYTILSIYFDKYVQFYVYGKKYKIVLYKSMMHGGIYTSTK